jgi:amidase
VSAVLHEATVDSIHAAYAAGELTCVALVQSCLARIEAYDQQGPALRALLTVNPEALRIAAEMDRQFRASGGRVGPLHGIPLILKDNLDTQDLATSGGNVAMRAFRPAADAFTVARLRQAGALILAKANLQEFARGGISISSLGGQVLNPYDLTRTPGGSSGGTGAAIAAGFAVLGVGSDTGQSIRSPASACSLVGVRPTRGLVSRSGLIPNSLTQDEVGPITRTVKDAARMLDVMAGYDPTDPVTALGVGRQPVSYVAVLDAASLKGARIGVMSNLSGGEARHAEVNAVMEQVVRNMQEQGALVQRFELPGYDALAARVATDRHEASAAMERYFADRDAPFASLRQVVESRTASPAIQQAMEAELALEGGLNDPDYTNRMLTRDTLRLAVLVAMADLGLDAVLYPLQRVLVAPVGESEQPERNGALSHGTGLPAVTFPAGFSASTPSAPLGVPVGAELLGREFSEGLLLSLAHAYEQAWPARKPPLGTPPLA